MVTMKGRPSDMLRDDENNLRSKLQGRSGENDDSLQLGRGLRPGRAYVNAGNAGGGPGDKPGTRLPHHLKSGSEGPAVNGCGPFLVENGAGTLRDRDPESSTLRGQQRPPASSPGRPGHSGAIPTQGGKI